MMRMALISDYVLTSLMTILMTMMNRCLTLFLSCTAFFRHLYTFLTSQPDAVADTSTDSVKDRGIPAPHVPLSPPAARPMDRRADFDSADAGRVHITSYNRMFVAANSIDAHIEDFFRTFLLFKITQGCCSCCSVQASPHCIITAHRSVVVNSGSTTSTVS